MSKYMEVKVNTNLISRINTSRLSDSERKAAIDRLRQAERLVDGFEWVAKKIKQFGARLFLKPSLKH